MNQAIYARERETEKLRVLVWRLTKGVAEVAVMFYLISGVVESVM